MSDNFKHEFLLASSQNPNAIFQLEKNLTDKNIACTINKSPENQHDIWKIYLHDKTDLERATNILEELNSNIGVRSKSFNADQWSSNSRKSNTHQLSPTLSEQTLAPFISHFLSKTGPFSLIIFISSVLVFIIFLAAQNLSNESKTLFDDILSLLFFFNADNHNTQNWPEIWRLFTPALLHFSAAHIIFNLIWWIELGGEIENKESSTKLLFIFLLSAAVSNSAQYWVTGPQFGGLSGVVFSLLGYQWMSNYRQLDNTKRYALNRGVMIVMLIWLSLGYLGIFDKIIGPIANTAHSAGLICGGLIGFIAFRKK